LGAGIAGGEPRQGAMRRMSGFGDSLRHARSNKGVTLAEAERAIRIPRKYLRALEEEDFTALPDGVYSRGIVRNYAQYLHLDPDDAIVYFDEIRGGTSGGFKVVAAVRPMEVPSHWAPNFALIAFVVVISAVLFAWLYSAFFAARTGSLPVPTPAQPTPTAVDVSAAILALTPTATLAATATAPPTATVPATPVIPTQPPATQAAAPAQQGARVQSAATNRSAAAPTVAPTAVAERHAATVQAQDAARVTVTVDGKVAYDQEMAPGEVQNFEGEALIVQSARATSVYLWIDGTAYGYLSKDSAQTSVSVP
jgi:cytoskeleton protein RodZ